LVVQTPNGRRQAGEFRDCFVPFEITGTRGEDYATVGVVVAIVLRSGLAQDLPFAPLVWKYLAGEKIGAEDVLAIDDDLRLLLTALKEEPRAVEWSVEDWTGQPIILPGHSFGEFVGEREIERYCLECVQFRLASVKPILKLIRTAFRINVGFKRAPLLTGALLSRMAQGLSLITVEHLKSITVYSKAAVGEQHPLMRRFWRVLAWFQPEERRLLLKFVAGLTRLPNARLNPEFRIIMDIMPSPHPDQALPTAATCFQTLRLPEYSSDDICRAKLLYAIQFCQTMENK
jgi:ubiquitin-protein ligase E3 A